VLADQVDEPLGQHARFACARARDQRQSPLTKLNRLPLNRCEVHAGMGESYLPSPHKEREVQHWIQQQ